MEGLLTDRPELMDPATGIIKRGTVTYYMDLLQGSDDWLAARLGILTASEMNKVLTPTLKVAANDKQRQHVFEIAAQRITQFVEPQYISDAMLRGHEDEMDACLIYADKCAPLTNCGFITNDRWGFTIGYSPDGLVGDDGLVECKSRIQKYQVQTIKEHVATGSATIPDEYALQCQTGLLVTGRDWLDFISYSGGLPMVVIRVYPDERVQTAILEAAEAFEAAVTKTVADFHEAQKLSTSRLFPTKRRQYEDILT